MFTSPVFAGEIHDAVKKRDIGLVKCLIEANPNCVNEIDEKGRTPLHWACCRNNLEMVQLLLDNGAEESINIANSGGYSPLWNEIDEEGRTPLHWACCHNNLKMVQLLLQNGATESVNKVDRNNQPPLYWACNKNNLEMAQLLLKHCTPETINKAGQYSQTPLSWACYKNNLEMVKLLLQNGATESVNKVDRNNQPPLYWACWKNNLEMVKLLLLHGATVTHKITSSWINNEFRNTSRNIRDYINAASEYDKARNTKEKIELVVASKRNKELYPFLIKLSLCRSIHKARETKRNFGITTFFKLYPKVKKQNENLGSSEKILNQTKKELHCKNMKSIIDKYFEKKERLDFLQTRKVLGKKENNMFNLILN